MKTCLFLTILALGFAGCARSGPAGSWTGKTQIDTSTLPTGLSPERQKLVDQMVETVKNSTVQLELRSDQTYTMTSNGVIKVIPSKTGLPSFTTETRVTTGTWKQTGNLIDIQVKTLDGKAVEPHGQTLTLSEDGKSMSIAPKSTGRDVGDSKVVFTRS